MPTTSIQETQLGQRRDNDNAAHSIYSPASGVTAIIKSVIACNVTTTAATISLYLDHDGTTYDQSTALVYGYSIAANTSEELLSARFLPMSDSSGNLAYQAGTSNSFTVTVSGSEIS